MLSHYGLVQVLRVKAYAQGTIRHAQISEGRYPFGRPGNRHVITPFSTISLSVHSICSLYLVGTFHHTHVEQG